MWKFQFNFITDMFSNGSLNKGKYYPLARFFEKRKEEETMKYIWNGRDTTQWYALRSIEIFVTIHHWFVICGSDNDKVIRSKSRASALSRTVRRTDSQTIFFKKTFKTAITTPNLLLHYSATWKRDKKPWKRLCDGRTDGPTDRKVAYRVA